MKITSKLGFNQRGDTIVEVLIAIVIVSAVLVGAFAVSNLSLKQLRMAQERGEAQKIAEQTVENLDAMVKNQPSLTTTNQAFCKDTSTLNSVPATSTQCKLGDQGRYSVSVRRIGAAGTTTFGFATTVTWPSLTSGTETLTINYRVDNQ